MNGPQDKKRRQDAIRAKRYRRNKKLRGEMAQEQEPLPEAYDTPLAREFFGLPPRTEAPTARFTSRHDDDLPVVDYGEGYIGRPGQSGYVPTPYGPEARRAAEEAERLADVVDYGQPRQDFASLDRTIRDRIVSALPNSVRRDAVLREAHIAHAMRTSTLAETPQYNESLTWDEMVARDSEPEEPEPDSGPYQHAVYFKAPWRTQNPCMSKIEQIQQQMAERNDAEMIDGSAIGWRR